MHRLSLALDTINASYQDFYESIGANPYEIQVMYALYVQHCPTQKQIADAHHMPKQTVNNIILRYQKKGYVTLIQDTKDKRARRVQVTEQGKHYIEKSLEPVFQLDKEAVETMGQKEFLRLAELTEQYGAIVSEILTQTRSHS